MAVRASKPPSHQQTRPQTAINRSINTCTQSGQFGFGVWVRGGWFNSLHQIGYIRTGLSEQLLDEIEAGNRIEARIADVTGGGWGQSYNVNILVRIAEHVDEPSYHAGQVRPGRAKREPASLSGSGCLVVFLVTLGLAFCDRIATLGTPD